MYVIEIAGEPPEVRRDDLDVQRNAGNDAEWYERLAPELIRFASTLVGPSSAEDLLGAAVIRAITAPTWTQVRNKRAYLYRTLAYEAHRTRRSTARRAAREAREYQRDGFEPSRVDPAVMRALRRLSVRQRAVIHLTYWADLAPQQVADMLDSSLRTVERDLTNARNKLENLLS
jgi:RNA polymerase sigma factor (sigma-70 family)